MSDTATAALTVRDREMLTFERSWSRARSDKVSAIRATFGLGEIAYYQNLNRVIDTPAALAADPVTVNRLQRARAGQLRTRRWAT